MTQGFTPRLGILPAAQRVLWPELASTPAEFTLYDGTAIALRLAHRPSIDFDFIALAPFEPNMLLNRIPYLKDADVRQASDDTLTVTVDRGGLVQLSYFGGLAIGQVAPAECAEGPKFQVASLIDLAGMKAAVLPQRVELRDYLDVHALLTQGRIPLPEMLAAARIIYGDRFNPLLTLKALAYHEDFTLAELPQSLRDDLSEAAMTTDVRTFPKLKAFRERPPNT